MAPRTENPPRAWTRPLAALAALGLLLGAGCGGDERGPFPIEPGRERAAPDRAVPPGATALERLGVLDEQGRPVLVPTLPAGWEQMPPSPMRVLSLRIPGGEPGDGDVSVSWAGGDVAGNVNRWLRQFEAPPLDEMALEALPRAQLAGGPAVVVEARGRFNGGMGGGPPREGQQLLGMVSLLPGRDRLFAKLVGPAALVEAQREAFETFCRTLVRAGSPSPGSARVPPGAPAQPPAAGPAPAAVTPPAGAGGSAPTPRAAGLDASRLAWELPAGWSAQKPRGLMRIMDFRVTAAPGIEGVLFQLASDGGGVLLNVNRWRGQMGQPELSADEVKALPRVPWLGREATWVEIPGHYQGMSGESVEGALFVGVVCLLEQDALFFRLVGPRSEVEAQREALRALLASMRTGG